MLVVCILYLPFNRVRTECIKTRVEVLASILERVGKRCSPVLSVGCVCFVFLYTERESCSLDSV